MNSETPVYPHRNLFNSGPWRARLQALGMTTPEFRVATRFGLRVAYLNTDYLTDFEEWPSTDQLSTLTTLRGVHVALFRKLLIEDQPKELPRGAFIWPCTVSPFLDLKEGIKPDASAMANIRRRERNLAQELGPLELTLSTDRERWFTDWSSRQIARQHDRGAQSILVGPEFRAVFQKWITAEDHPDWMKLFELRSGTRTLAAALCYEWDGVFYFQLPAFDPDPSLKKFGLGKLFVQKLIDWALARGLSIFDFLQGDEAYKFDWNPTVRTLYQCEVPLSTLGHLLVRLRRMSGRYPRSRQQVQK